MGYENNRLDESELEKASGGYIVQGPDGKYFVVDDKTGENLRHAAYTSLDAAKDAAEVLGQRPDEISYADWQNIIAFHELSKG